MVSNIFTFTPNLGEDEPILTHIFQLGWFNHQAVKRFTKWSGTLLTQMDRKVHVFAPELFYQENWGKVWIHICLKSLGITALFFPCAPNNYAPLPPKKQKWNFYLFGNLAPKKISKETCWRHLKFPLSTFGENQWCSANLFSGADGTQLGIGTCLVSMLRGASGVVWLLVGWVARCWRKRLLCVVGFVWPKRK